MTTTDVVILGEGLADVARAQVLGKEGVGVTLANGSDQVGRNYMFHNRRAFLAISTEKYDTKFQKTVGVNDDYFGDDDYPMGNVQMVGKSSAPMYRGEKPIESGLAPTSALRDVAEFAIDFCCQPRISPIRTTGSG